MKKLLSILIATSISITALSGCSSKTINAQSSSTTQTHRRFNPSSIKTRYANVLKTLVADKTITQEQSDKILVEITKETSNRKQNNKNQNNRQKGIRSGTRKNQLSSLVTSGVITQAQADAINQKLKNSKKQ
ncbi:hypothetical protein ACJDT4_22940 [Clostridium neuense]|uniref:Lipoprotein n=1 Tax=Clostridium neuense TaxID=1728934 RepID=A0ABW8TP77_9CLOT